MLLMQLLLAHGLLTIGERCSKIMPRGSSLHHSEAYLRKRFLLDKKSIEDIAKECGVSVQIIYKQLKKFGLKK